METIWSKEIDTVLSIGRSLQDVGVRNWALTREKALYALDQLAKKGVAVLGGDVYMTSDGKIEPTYDNWYCDHEQGELDVVFIERSIAQARSYIYNYKETGKKNIYFAIVPKI
jgi:hypothetical protein